MIDQDLEEITEQETDIILCGYCDRELDIVKAYKSKTTGAPYCNEYCFYMFTED